MVTSEIGWHVVEGCTRISPGCLNCYAADALRQEGRTFTPRFNTRQLQKPLQAKRPAVFFVGPFGDLFHEKIPFKFIDAVFEVIKETPRHLYHVLTKRPERMVSYFEDKGIPQNVWFGVSAENKEYGEPRIQTLQKLKGRAAVLFVAAEPFLGDLPDVDLSGIDWLSINKEYGTRARDLDVEAMLRLQKQCASYGVNVVNMPPPGTPYAKWGIESCKYLINKGDDYANIDYYPTIVINGSRYKYWKTRCRNMAGFAQSNRASRVQR